MLLASVTSNRSKFPEGMLSGSLFGNFIPPARTDEDCSEHQFDFVGSNRFNIQSDPSKVKAQGRPEIANVLNNVYPPINFGEAS